ncbi:uncharacterized protein K02A2.6-like [Toxorhynchites rutilus septentrionalis]|uniref:uncharacterized protein K02A2.6-like n=1 Tax=Toxorhynchites rutilus septentrionalis TaxID=329112 RepID=UPI00247B224B|nr:uncharacterized protein K02A2.6-like [Toxorhynchites rutilus septentrionalis]
MKQGTNERFSQFILRLRQQLADCGLEKYPQEVRAAIEEMMLTDVIVEGCSSQELRRRILEKDQNLADIEALGASLESVRAQEKEISAGSSHLISGSLEVRKIQKLRTDNPDVNKKRVLGRFNNKPIWKESASTICYSCGQMGHISKALCCPAKGKICRRCKRPGHFENVCRKRPGEYKNLKQTGKVQAIDETPEENDCSAVTKPELSSETQEKKVYYTFHFGNSCNMIDCTVGGLDIQMLVDSGSDANLITADSWELLKSRKVDVQHCQKGSKKILKSYGSQNPLKILGTFFAHISAGGRTVQAEFFVVVNGQRNLLGDKTAKELGVLRVGLDINRIVDGNNQSLVPFSKIKDIQINIQMDPNIKPVFQPLRRIPMPLEDAVNKKLDELLARDIIEKKTGPANWVSPLVVANKANGEIRLCVDLRRVNQAVIRDRHPMPVIEDVLAKVGRGNIWSTLDVKDAFSLLELDEPSRDIVTFISHRGLYRFKRLPFGLVSAPEIFQRIMDEILADCDGAYWYLDDVGVEGGSMDEHDRRLNKV